VVGTPLPQCEGTFVNREHEVDTVFELLFANVARARHVGQKNSYPLNIAVAAQHLGTGKTTLALQFRDAVKIRSIAVLCVRPVCQAG
jgi:hypothetical protein